MRKVDLYRIEYCLGEVEKLIGSDRLGKHLLAMLVLWVREQHKISD